MADKEISALPSAASIADTDELVLNQGAGGSAFVTKRIAVSVFKSGLALPAPLSNRFIGRYGQAGFGYPVGGYYEVTSTTAKFCGFGAAGLVITPGRTDKVKFSIDFLAGCIAYTSGGGLSGVYVKYGTGTAPAAGTNLSGIGSEALFGGYRYLRPMTITTGADFYRYHFQDVVTGLTLGTTYWFDMGGFLHSGVFTHYIQMDAFILEEVE